MRRSYCMFGFVFSFGWEYWSLFWFLGQKIPNVFAHAKCSVLLRTSAWSLLQYAVSLMRSQIVLEYFLIDKI